jgi:hypothetical protein
LCAYDRTKITLLDPEPTALVADGNEGIAGFFATAKAPEPRLRIVLLLADDLEAHVERLRCGNFHKMHKDRYGGGDAWETDGLLFVGVIVPGNQED